MPVRKLTPPTLAKGFCSGYPESQRNERRNIGIVEANEDVHEESIVPEIVPNQEEACQSDEAEQTDPAMDPAENWKHYQVATKNSRSIDLFRQFTDAMKIDITLNVVIGERHVLASRLIASFFLSAVYWVV